MKGEVRRGHIARNSMRSSSSSNRSPALEEEEEEEELRQSVAVRSLQTVCAVQPAYRPSPFQPAAQLAVALPSQLPSPAPPAHHPTQHPSQARLPRVTFADLPPSYSKADLQSLPKYSEITSV